MVSFEKPGFTFSFDLTDEIDLLMAHKLKESRFIPPKQADRLLVCTWNIANLGLHKRGEDHYRIIAEVLSWFDIIAVQEVHDNLEGLYKLEQFIGTEYELIFNDRGGNDERAAFFFDGNKVQRLELTGEVGIPVGEHKWIKIKDIDQEFRGFDRNPFIASFSFNDVSFSLINAHLFFGSKSDAKALQRRALEAFAVGRYADLRSKDMHAFTDYFIALGDFNIPKAEKGDTIFDALTKRGLVVPEHSTKIASSIMSDAQYDQIAFFPNIKRKVKASGVFDYDTVIFPGLWDQHPSSFKKYCRYYISDHRPMWVQLEL